MNRDYVAGRLKQFNGKLREQWCKLHNDQIGMIAARRHQIAGRIQAQCSLLRKESAQQLKAFKQRCRTWQKTSNTVSARKQQAPQEAANRRTSTGLTSVKNYADISHA